MKRKVIKEIDRLIEEATERIENSLLLYDRTWYRGFRAGLSVAKKIIEKKGGD